MTIRYIHFPVPAPDGNVRQIAWLEANGINPHNVVGNTYGRLDDATRMLTVTEFERDSRGFRMPTGGAGSLTKQRQYWVDRGPEEFDIPRVTSLKELRTLRERLIADLAQVNSLIGELIEAEAEAEASVDDRNTPGTDQ